MRILHTSDWHLGRQFGPAPLIEYQRQFLNWFVELCTSEKVDLVAIAGDLYDRAIPPTEAIELFEGTVRRLVNAGVHVAAITGNHDSDVRVTVYNALLDSCVHLQGGYENIGEVITLDFPDGPLDLVLLPFLEPRMAADVFGIDGNDTEGDESDADNTMARRQRRTHESVLRTAADLARTHLTSPRSLCLSHAFVTGGTESESERQLTVGGSSLVPIDVFAGFSYTALGHLHRPQELSSTVRYSGTPLAYSFSEDHSKSVLIIDMDAQGVVTVNQREIPVGRKVCTIEGTLEALLTNPDYKDFGDHFVRAKLTNTTVVINPRAQLETAFPHLIELSQAAINSSIGEVANVEAGRSPFDTTLAFWNAATGSEPNDDEREALRAAIESATAVAQ